MKIFDKTIRIRDYICSPTGGYTCGNNRVNLYIYANGFCPAHCSFCPGFNSKTEIDFEKLRTALTELHNKQVINRIAITGGEPLINLDRFDKVLNTISDICGKEYHVSVNTNGTNLSRLENIDHFEILDDVHISRHSEDDDENNRIFGIRTPSLEQIKEISGRHPNKFGFSCNLMRGVIDNPDRLRRYLDSAIYADVYLVGFVSLMDKTSNCKELFVDFEEITSKLYVRDGFLFEKMAKDTDSCKCENYTYYNTWGQISFYLRRVLGGQSNCVKNFSFNLDNNLVTNFGKTMV